MKLIRFLLRPVLVCAFVALLIGRAAPAAAGSTDTNNLRDVRYCEIIPSVVTGSITTTYVYNTLTFNRCPRGQWSQITEGEVNREFGSQSAQLNGPRHWVMDEIQASGSTTTGETFTFGTIEMGLRGIIVTPTGTPTVGNQFYVPNQVQRDTIFVYKAGQPIFILTDPLGNEYVMQSYAQIVDTTLMYKDLPNLASELRLPSGWQFSTRTLTQDLQMNSNGLAIVVNDDLANSYQLNP
ncbi:hypothetical protein [Edaphobacter aggregans]|uniref:hypothetical protein n=1 Tax=Edaphobacter aggregans TaxID=570835 RepID=UPI000690D9C6|nr:hypothetical protein [Edaphobacter aggregans]